VGSVFALNISEETLLILAFGSIALTGFILWLFIDPFDGGFSPSTVFSNLTNLGKRRTESKINRLYRSWSLRTNGEYRVFGFKADPVVRFVADDITITLSRHRLGRNSKTQYHRLLLKPYVDHQARLEIYPQRHFHRAIKLLAMDDVIIGDTSFDDRYAIATSDENTAIHLLTPEVRVVIDQLRELQIDDNVYVNLVGGELEVRKPIQGLDIDFLEEYVALGIKLMKAMLASGQSGMEFIVSAMPSEDPICQICGEAISEAVTCKRCDTPHHRDCWEYYGSCAVYSCGGKGFRK